MFKHTFVICAYKESRYLESCIRSLLHQTVKSEIIMATSTPNGHIRRLAEKYNIPLYINTGESGIAGDWNFAYSRANTEYVTIAHQDDIYAPPYAEKLMEKLDKAKNPTIGFTGYFEVRNGKYVKDNLNNKIKRFLLMPLSIKGLGRSAFIRRRCLSLGNPICCPSVMYVKKNLDEHPFDAGFKSNLDWETWAALSTKKNSEFVYCHKPLMGHRIHEESATSTLINNNKRIDEDYKMFCKFWPSPVARLLTRMYANSEKSNKI